MEELTVLPQQQEPDYSQYEATFKALADQKRLRIMYELTQRGKTCVCDLVDIVGMPQSSLSYHLKLLVDANLVCRETHGTWGYYEINEEGVSAVLSEQLCCIFRPSSAMCRDGCC